MNYKTTNPIGSDQPDLEHSIIAFDDTALICAELLKTRPLRIRIVTRDGHPLTGWLDEPHLMWNTVCLEMAISHIAEEGERAFSESEFRNVRCTPYVAEPDEADTHD